MASILPAQRAYSLLCSGRPLAIRLPSVLRRQPCRTALTPALRTRSAGSPSRSFTSARNMLQGRSDPSESDPSSTTPNTAAPETLPKPDYLDEQESAIWDRLVAEFAPAELSVRDVSGGCGSMYAISLASARFRGLTLIKQQRMVNTVLADKIAGWHGVQLQTRGA